MYTLSLKKICVASAVFAAGLTTLSTASAVVVDEILTVPSNLEDDWAITAIAGGGTASIVDLTGLGGDLENNQPLSTGAAKLTTGLADPDRAEIGTVLDFGLASDLLKSVDLAYSFYKATVAGGNVFAAPALKLTIYAAGGTGDNWGQLVFEPYLNGTNPPTPDVWTNVVIDENTGSGVDTTAGWWWTGGFEILSSSGGNPYRSLSEWADAFASSDGTDFANAHVVGLAVGVGTYNQGQLGYVDDIRIDTGSINKTYDFETAAVPDSGSMIGLLMFSLTALIGFRRISSRR
ncbi:hypothetical protein VDG1235_2833 [Verrucomicrobiia bacterium DG1235]|nr:hypothetical protein VDG1235_2833 [Verrucomicrobiae bacterium DG1235]